MKKTTHKSSAGFTIIELMVLVAVVAVTMAVGLPQLNVFFKGNRMVSNTNELVAALQTARSQAIKEGSRVSICKSADAASCSTSANWEDGWIVFVEDPVGPTIGDFGGTDGPILRSHSGAEGNVTITPNNTQIENYVSFTSRGTPKQGNGVSQSGLFKICDDRGLKNAGGTVIARGVEVAASGRIRATSQESKLVACP